MKRKTIPQNNFSSSGVPTVQTKFSSLRREFRQRKPISILFVGGSDGVNQFQSSSSGVPTVQTKFNSPRREFRQCKPSSVLFVGSSDGVNQFQFIAGASILLGSTLPISAHLLFFVSTSEAIEPVKLLCFYYNGIGRKYF